MKVTKLSVDKSKKSNLKISVTKLKNNKKVFNINLFGFEFRVTE